MQSPHTGQSTLGHSRRNRFIRKSTTPFPPLRHPYPVGGKPFNRAAHVFFCRSQSSSIDYPSKGDIMPQYMLLIYDDEKMWARMQEGEKGKVFGEYMEFTQSIVKSGHFRAGDPLQPTSTATSIRQ